MLALLPIVHFGLLCLWFHSFSAGQPSKGPRISVLQAVLGSGLTVTLITEALGSLGCLSRLSVAAAWALVDVAVLVPMIMRRRHLRWRLLPTNCTLRLKPIAGLLIAGTTIYCLGTLAAAVLSAPNSFDAMTYHLPRVMHWLQSGSLDFYPTPILRQLHQSPWSEYALLNLQVLHGSDRLANCVQWTAYCGCLVSVSLIAKELGAELRTQLLATVIAATIPMAILQASGTQTDCIASLWCAILVLSLLQYGRKPDWATAMSIAASAALAALTKPTTGLFAMPFILSFAWTLAQNCDRRRLAQTASIILLVLGVNAPHWSRNVSLYHSPLGPSAEGPHGSYKYTNDMLSPRVLASNLLRNTALHINTLPSVDQQVEHLVVSAHSLLSLDPSDERTTWTWTSFSMSGLSLNEGSAGNLLHLCMACVALGALVAIPRQQRAKVARYWAKCIAAYILFCLALRWQPWNSRLHLPLFMLVAPATAIGVSRFRERTLWPVIGLILVCSLPYLLFNPTRALWRLPDDWLVRCPVLDGICPDRTLFENPRWKHYFYDQLVHDSYRDAVGFVVDSGETSIGLFLEMNDYEYPYWALLSELGHHDVQLLHLGVDNISGTLYPQDRQMAPRLALVRHPVSSPELVWQGYTYRPAFVAEHSAVYERAP